MHHRVFAEFNDLTSNIDPTAHQGKSPHTVHRHFLGSTTLTQKEKKRKRKHGRKTRITVNQNTEALNANIVKEAMRLTALTVRLVLMLCVCQGEG